MNGKTTYASMDTVMVLFLATVTYGTSSTMEQATCKDVHTLYLSTTRRTPLSRACVLCNRKCKRAVSADSLRMNGICPILHRKPSTNDFPV